MWRPFSGLLGHTLSLRSPDHGLVSASQLRAQARRNTAVANLYALLFPGLLATSWSPLSAQSVSLGQAQSFSVLGNTTVTNAGASIVVGDVGLSPGTSVTGFPPGTILNGSLHINDVLAGQAQQDASLAYTTLAGRAPTANLSGQDLGGMTLLPGVYRFNTSAALTGTLLLDTRNDPNGTFIFQIGSSLGLGPAPRLRCSDLADRIQIYFGRSAALLHWPQTLILPAISSPPPA